MGLFGIGNLISGLLEKAHLGWVMDAIKIYADFSTGNWLALVGDVQHLASRFSDYSFMDRVDREPPLGRFGQSSNSSTGYSSSDCFGTTPARANLIADRAATSNNSRVSRATDYFNDHISMANSISYQRESTRAGVRI
jgi:hypothetical protein